MCSCSWFTMDRVYVLGVTYNMCNNCLYSLYSMYAVT
jgi:hypothetical protein